MAPLARFAFWKGRMDSPATEAASRADFSHIRYAQVWEDADILVEALNIGPESTCLSIASAGDNVLALLAHSPKKVYALDLNPAQLHCLALRAAAFRCLEHSEILELIGARASSQRGDLYARCRDCLDEGTRSYWDGQMGSITAGIGSAGKFERYFALFRKRVLPLVHGKRSIAALLEPKSPQERERFYAKRWNNLRWRLLFCVFFSRFMMGRLGRDPAFFQYVEGSVAERILERTRYALTALEPSENPYLHWILRGDFGDALPLYLREEHFETIRRNLDRLEWRLTSVEEFTAELHEPTLDACNLSDIFEYMSEENTGKLLKELCRVCRSEARLAYWNMLAPRSRPDALANQLAPLKDLATSLFKQDKAFFYSRFVVEERTA